LKTCDICVFAQESLRQGRYEINVPLRCDPPAMDGNELIKKLLRVCDALEKRHWKMAQYEIKEAKRGEEFTGCATFTRG
jgi:hypothetical protein